MRVPAATIRAGDAVPSAVASSRLPASAVVGDALVIARRNLLHIVRTPELMVFATVQPIVFLLLFRYVFGEAIHVPGGSYVDYLIPGIIVQTVVFGAPSTSVGLAEDMSKGVIDRFRSLPMASSAVLAGRTIADLARNAFVVVLMLAVGMLVGFRLHNGLAPALAAIVLALALGYALSWPFALVGLSVTDPEAAQLAGLLPIFPLVFASSIFTPVETMPAWLQAFAEVQPITRVANAVRALTQGRPVAAELAWSALWIVVLLAAFAPWRCGGTAGGDRSRSRAAPGGWLPIRRAVSPSLATSEMALPVLLLIFVPSSLCRRAPARMEEGFRRTGREPEP